MSLLEKRVRVLVLTLAAAGLGRPARADDSLGAAAPLASISRRADELKTSGAAARPTLDWADDKPLLFDGPEASRRKCELLSRRAAARGVDTLVIAFEGLISFDSAGAAAADEYQKDLAAGDPMAARPLPVLVPVLRNGYVLHGLIVPLIEKYRDGFDFLVFRHLAQPGVGDFVPAVCAKAWSRGAVSRPRRLIVIGHSMGGLAASLLAKTLDDAGIPVDLLVTLDPFPAPIPRGGNVRRWENYMQRLPLPGVGVDVPDADLNKTIWLATHFDITGKAEVVDSVSRRLGALIAAGAPR